MLGLEAFFSHRVLYARTLSRLRTQQTDDHLTVHKAVYLLFSALCRKVPCSSIPPIRLSAGIEELTHDRISSTGYGTGIAITSQRDPTLPTLSRFAMGFSSLNTEIRGPAEKVDYRRFYCSTVQYLYQTRGHYLLGHILIMYSYTVPAASRTHSFALHSMIGMHGTRILQTANTLPRKHGLNKTTIRFLNIDSFRWNASSEP